MLKTLDQESPKMSTSFIHCKNRHDLIWFWDDAACPVCQALSVIDEMKDLIEDMESSLYDAATELESIQSRVSELEDEA